MHHHLKRLQHLDLTERVVEDSVSIRVDEFDGVEIQVDLVYPFGRRLSNLATVPTGIKQQWQLSIGSSE
jgi:hypothetical protein